MSDYGHENCVHYVENRDLVNFVWPAACLLKMLHVFSFGSPIKGLHHINGSAMKMALNLN